MSFGHLGTMGRGFGKLGASPVATPSWVLSGASIDMDFANARYYGGSPASLLTITRASSKTDLRPASASGFAYTTFSSNVLAITPGSGLLIEEARTNQLLNSTVPATQTTASLGTGTYTLWVNGSGSATSSAGSATITGAGAATNGTPNVFTVTVAGTVTVTVSGSLNAFQLEAGAFGTSFIVTAGVTATRAADNVATILVLKSLQQSAALTQYTKTNTLLGGVNARLGLGYSGNLTVAFENSTTTVGIYNGAQTQTGTIGTSGNISTGVVNTVGSFSSTSITIVANGGTDGVNAVGFTPTATAMIGSNNGSGLYIDGYLQRLALWNNQLTTATRVQLSRQ